MNNKPPYLQAHCQSPTSQPARQSFVKELAKPTHNRQTDKTKEEQRTANSGSCCTTPILENSFQKHKI